VAAHSHLVDCDPDAPVSEVTADEHAPIRKFLTDYIPDLAACDFTADVCLYSSTPDGEFALGPIPDHRNVFTAALAGHGFKFAPVLGEILADMTMECSPVFDVSMFSINRFANAKLA
jgi:sarcosine oxidase